MVLAMIVGAVFIYSPSIRAHTEEEKHVAAMG